MHATTPAHSTAKLLPTQPATLQGYFGRECANEALALEYNKPLLKEEAGFEYDYYALPKLADSEVHNTVEVKVQASFSSSAGYSAWVSARPELLLLKVCKQRP